MPRRFSLVVIAPCLTAFTSLAQEQSITPKHSRHFTRYEGCEFVPTKYADGDSFKVRIGADEFVLRLYYVDAPASDERFADRNAEQAAYFGITPAESVEAGKAAKEFVSGLLTGKKFVVFTRWATALGSSKLPRYYAIIEVDARDLVRRIARKYRQDLRINLAIACGTFEAAARATASAEDILFTIPSASNTAIRGCPRGSHCGGKGNSVYLMQRADSINPRDQSPSVY